MDETDKALGKGLLICPLEGAVEMLHGKHCIERASGYHGHLGHLVLTAPGCTQKLCGCLHSAQRKSCTGCSEPD